MSHRLQILVKHLSDDDDVYLNRFNDDDAYLNRFQLVILQNLFSLCVYVTHIDALI
jgi:hypothetical protein